VHCGVLPSPLSDSNRRHSLPSHGRRRRLEARASRAGSPPRNRRQRIPSVTVGNVVSFVMRSVSPGSSRFPGDISGQKGREGGWPWLPQPSGPRDLRLRPERPRRAVTRARSRNATSSQRRRHRFCGPTFAHSYRRPYGNGGPCGQSRPSDGRATQHLASDFGSARSKGRRRENHDSDGIPNLAGRGRHS
jgi:hypothetical protein